MTGTDGAAPARHAATEVARAAESEATLDWRDKGVWPVDGPTAAAGYVASGHTLFDGSLSWPAMVLRADALEHNLAALADFTRRHRLEFAPHGKTTMAPALHARQLAAGAWGITVATPAQARVARGFGVPRVLLANEVLDATALDWIAAELDRDAGAEIPFWVDSAEGVEAAGAAARAHPGLTGGLGVLVDVGHAGGRTGVRTAGEARAIAEAVAATDGVRLVGVACYEGALPDVEAVRGYFATVRTVVDDLLDAGLLRAGAIVSAGGSAYFDLVAAELGGAWAEARGARILLRSGAYIAHDDGVYTSKTAYRRIPEQGSLEAAIEVWAQVLSVPEEGLAIVGMGKRDAPVDEGMPVPLAVRRRSAAVPPRRGAPLGPATAGPAADGPATPDATGPAAHRSPAESLRGRAEVTGLDDQHGYLRSGPDVALRPGDLVCFGISHPCTAFDKWRVVPVVDADDRVVDLVRTYF